ncbi:hypothetical protein [Hymenobacter properus]|uniref:Uncharacterized protein n=1 Tax=Hymenobacter properus TaxID=2791026 RepID=A0A931BHM0_9BACT|nr:hypothetical protein [Hymenobacter properus]MBF9144114.1 hypothetical protein [Hymenobacter properus]MBR7722930.1 hypothetical protein [Microvirga sp. SRT04]
MHSEPFDDFSAPAPAPVTAPATAEAPPRRHPRLNEAAVATATRLLPLLRLLDTLQPLVTNDSVFHTKRVKIQEEMTRAYGELLAEKPRHKALLHAFKTLGDLVREEAHDLSKDELKQAAREVVLATLKNAPGLISAAHNARLLT